RGKEDPYLRIGEENDRTVDAKSNMVWSLKNLDFEINQGEAVGIIGRNGAGKSTLLKILSRITTPTTGSVKIKGRIASLLEVGTGFHPELTGRENIFLNGAILGMRKNEIKKKFNEIVDFSGVERYIDTPVKRYSSGMYVRLAFAVAAHLESEILIVDEVLAVGDAEFQKKCLGKMEDVRRNDGRTVLFVSHNMGVISQLCKKTIVLKGGGLLFQGPTERAIDYYLNNIKDSNVSKISRIALNDTNQFLLVFNSDANREEKIEFKLDEDIILNAELYIPKWVNTFELAVSLYDKYKRRIFTIHEPLKKYYLGKPKMSFSITIPSNFITPGIYSWILCINQPGIAFYDLLDDVCSFSILDTGSDFSQYENYGCVFVNYKINYFDETNSEEFIKDGRISISTDSKEDSIAR
ncbi:MAG: polysaccharide ABC transporter ATP-binding protein, partial [Segetibacter sp.]